MALPTGMTVSSEWSGGTTGSGSGEYGVTETAAWPRMGNDETEVWPWLDPVLFSAVYSLSHLDWWAQSSLALFAAFATLS